MKTFLDELGQGDTGLHDCHQRNADVTHGKDIPTASIVGVEFSTSSHSFLSVSKSNAVAKSGPICVINKRSLFGLDLNVPSVLVFQNPC